MQEQELQQKQSTKLTYPHNGQQQTGLLLQY